MKEGAPGATGLVHDLFGQQLHVGVVVGVLVWNEVDQAGPTATDADHAVPFSERSYGDGANRWFEVTLKEGRNREVRRLFEAIGYEVSRLIRTGYGPVALPRSLPRGKHVALPAGQARELYEVVGLSVPQELRKKKKRFTTKRRRA